jgi:hypothetical protein
VPAQRRRFGYIRKLPSGRYQASFVGPSGLRQSAPSTFKTKTDADRWLAAAEADITRGTWLAEDLGRESLGNYARAWLHDHSGMGPRYRETCERNLRLHLAPLHDVPLRAISPAVVREWHASALRGKGGRTSIQQSYRFLRAVMNTAVRDGAIAKNPCQILGAGSDRAKERPVATPAQVVALIEAITPRYRAAVLLAAWCGLRRGEVLGLLPGDVDLVAKTVTVRRNRVELLENNFRPWRRPARAARSPSGVTRRSSRCSRRPGSGRGSWPGSGMTRVTRGAAMSTCGGGRSPCAARAAGRGWSGSGTRLPVPGPVPADPVPACAGVAAAAVAGGEQPRADDRERDLPDDRQPRPSGRGGCLDAPVPAPFQPHLAGPRRGRGRPDGAERLVLPADAAPLRRARAAPARAAPTTASCRTGRDTSHDRVTGGRAWACSSGAR